MKLIGAKLKLTNLNSSREREGEDDNGPLRYDLKLEGPISVEDCKGLFSDVISHALLLEILFTEDGDLKTRDVEEVSITSEAKACRAEIEYGLGTLEFVGARFGKITLTPHTGRMCSLTCRLQVYPDDDQIIPLNRAIKHDLTITVNGDTTLTTAKADDARQQALAMPPGTSVSMLDRDDPSVQEALRINDERGQQLSDAGVISIGNALDSATRKLPPSTAHGEVEVEGQRPPQRARKKPPAAKTETLPVSEGANILDNLLAVFTTRAKNLERQEESIRASLLTGREREDWQWVQRDRGNLHGEKLGGSVAISVLGGRLTMPDIWNFSERMGTSSSGSMNQKHSGLKE